MTTLPTSAKDSGHAHPIHYPDSDGKPMAESDQTRDLMFECIDTLSRHFAKRSDVYVSGNILIYYKEGKPQKSVSPDVLVALGTEKKQRRIWQTWVEGKMPEVVFEICSDSTWRTDLGIKAALYCSLGVQEYFLFDPTGLRFGDGPLVGMQRRGEEFVEIEPSKDGRLPSNILGLKLAEENGHLCFYDLKTKEKLLSTAESEALALDKAKSAEQKAKSAEQKAKSAEQKAKSAEQKANTEHKKRKEAQKQAERLEKELQKMKEKLEQLQNRPSIG